MSIETIGGPTYEDRIRAAERERCAKLIPTTWLDPLLSGETASKLPLGQHAVERLLLEIRNRILKSE